MNNKEIQIQIQIQIHACIPLSDWLVKMNGVRGWSSSGILRFPNFWFRSLFQFFMKFWSILGWKLIILRHFLNFGTVWSAERKSASVPLSVMSLLERPPRDYWHVLNPTTTIFLHRLDPFWVLRTSDCVQLWSTSTWYFFPNFSALLHSAVSRYLFCTFHSTVSISFYCMRFFMFIFHAMLHRCRLLELDFFLLLCSDICRFDHFCTVHVSFSCCLLSNYLVQSEI